MALPTSFCSFGLKHSQISSFLFIQTGQNTPGLWDIGKKEGGVECAYEAFVKVKLYFVLRNTIYILTRALKS